LKIAISLIDPNFGEQTAQTGERLITTVAFETPRP